MIALDGEESHWDRGTSGERRSARAKQAHSLRGRSPKRFRSVTAARSRRSLTTRSCRDQRGSAQPPRMSHLAARRGTLEGARRRGYAFWSPTSSITLLTLFHQ
jgi:hypothetical protein